MGISWEEGPRTKAIRKSIPSVKYFIFGLPFRHFFSAPVLRVERRFYIVRKVLPGWPFIPPHTETVSHHPSTIQSTYPFIVDLLRPLALKEIPRWSSVFGESSPIRFFFSCQGSSGIPLFMFYNDLPPARPSIIQRKHKCPGQRNHRQHRWE